MAFFDYIKDSSNVPEGKAYERSKGVTEVLQSKGKYDSETNSITLSSSSLMVDASMLNGFINSKELRQGQSTPFDELPITRIEYDQAGNAYYKVSPDTQVNGFNYSSSSTISGDTSSSSSQSSSSAISGNPDTATSDEPLYTTPSSGK